MSNRWGKSGWIFWAPKSVQMVTAAMKLKTLIPWKESYGQPRQHIKKQRLLCQQSPSVKAMVFPAVLWELDCQESWVLKNWCFWTVVFEKTLESPLDCKEIHPVHPKGDQSWVFIEGLMLKPKLHYFGHLMRRTDSFEKTLMVGKIEGGRRRGQQDETVEWHHRLAGHEFE